MQDKPEYQPLLAPGRHRMSLADIERLCVDKFPESASRGTLFEALEGLARYLGSVLSACEIWVDGSFVTEKPNPGDVDLTVIVPGEVFDRLAVVDQPAAASLLSLAQGDGRFGPALHVFVIASRPMDHPDYPVLKKAADDWSQWWSVTRERWIKGFAVVRMGESDVALRILS